MQLKSIKNLLTSTKTIVEHQKKLERIKGEKFNVFSILKMESKENDTHSNFIGELLNPHGSHFKGNIFLKLFFQEINYTGINPESTSVYLEYFIGKRDDEGKTGGRIDIFLMDGSKNCVSIENKIYAIDQFAQIERYVKHNKTKNKVYYLTLNGTEPDINSSGELIANGDYYIISYRETIVNWLNKCVKESSDSPIVRETIRQYILLIKKLTSTMNDKEEQELIQLILNNFEESSYISNNISRAKEQICEEIRSLTINGLQLKLGDKFEIVSGNPISTKYAQIWLKPKGFDNPEVYFGVESFSGKSEYNNLFIGTFIFEDKKKEYKKLDAKEKDDPYWAYSIDISDFSNFKSALSQPVFIQYLATNDRIKIEFVDHIIEETVNYINNYENNVIEYLKSIRISK